METANRRFGCIFGGLGGGHGRRLVLTSLLLPADCLVGSIRPPANIFFLVSSLILNQQNSKRKGSDGVGAGKHLEGRKKDGTLSAVRHGRVRWGREATSSSRGGVGRGHTPFAIRKVHPMPALKLRGRREKSPTVRRTNLWNKGLTSADRSNKATLPFTVPRSHSSRLQRIHPRTYDRCNSRTSPPSDFRPSGPARRIWFTSRGSIQTRPKRAGPTSPSLARILA